MAGATVDEAKKASMNLLKSLKEADGIFCPNELSTIGMLLTYGMRINRQS